MCEPRSRFECRNLAPKTVPLFGPQNTKADPCLGPETGPKNGPAFESHKTKNHVQHVIKNRSLVLHLGERDLVQNANLPMPSCYRARHLLAHIIAFTSAAVPFVTGLKGNGIFSECSCKFWSTSSVEEAPTCLLTTNNPTNDARHKRRIKKNKQCSNGTSVPKADSIYRTSFGDRFLYET